MKLFAPNYYKKFSCIADKCKHSCCIGWEIDIDNGTYEQYRNINTDFGKKLKENIAINDDCAYFKLSNNDRCPFLNENNLCEIILRLGENALCQICADHPRFKNFYGDRVEIGLGLTCEEASRIIINENEPFELTEIDDSLEDGIIYDDEADFFALRNEIFKIIEGEADYHKIIDKTLEKFNLTLPEKPLDEWIEIYLGLEILDNSWADALKNLKAVKGCKKPAINNTIMKNLLTYFIYRHLGESVYDGRFNGRILFAIHGCDMISALCSVNMQIEDVARMYSSEIEYSDENLNKLIDFLQNESLED